MYDGCHKKSSHYNSLNYYLPCFNDIFIYIIDDLNLKKIKENTLLSINENKLVIKWQKEIFSKGNPGIQKSKNDWHNGICIFLLQKSQSLSELNDS